MDMEGAEGADKEGRTGWLGISNPEGMEKSPGMEKWLLLLELAGKCPLLLELGGGGAGRGAGCDGLLAWPDGLCELSAGAGGRFDDRDRREVGSKSLDEELSERWGFGGSGRGLAMTPDDGKVKSPGMERSPGMDKLAPGIEGFAGIGGFVGIGGFAGIEGFDSSLGMVGLATVSSSGPESLSLPLDESEEFDESDNGKGRPRLSTSGPVV